MYTNGNVVIFDTIDQDEQAFLAWRDTHTTPEHGAAPAVIANIPRRPGTNSGDPVCIHPAPFKRLRKSQNYVNKAFYKACSLDPVALRTWITTHGTFSAAYLINTGDTYCCSDSLRVKQAKCDWSPAIRAEGLQNCPFLSQPMIARIRTLGFDQVCLCCNRCAIIQLDGQHTSLTFEPTSVIL
jgi:hypothetical protein